jgi:hypothetical protein
MNRVSNPRFNGAGAPTRYRISLFRTLSLSLSHSHSVSRSYYLANPRVLSCAASALSRRIIKRILISHVMSQTVLYDVASTLHQTLLRGLDVRVFGVDHIGRD